MRGDSRCILSKSDHDNLNVKSELYGTDIGNMIWYSVIPESLKTT